jgi:uncharacterized iron-regulated protein
MSTEQTEPTVITLNDTNSIQIMAQYIEVAQQKGAFLLSEAELLKRAIDILVNRVPDNEITLDLAKNLLIQGVNKGQKSGSYTLNDASLLSKVVQFVNSSLPQEQQQQQQQQQEAPRQEVQQIDDLSDLSDLAEPIPLKPKEV